MRRNTLGPWLALVLVTWACRPPKGDDETDSTSSSSTGSGTTISAVTSTTDAAGPCGVDGVQFQEMGFHRYDLEKVSADYLLAADCNGDARTDLILDNGTTRELSVLYWNGPDDFQVSAASKRSGGGGSDIQIFAADFDRDVDVDVGILQFTMEVVPLTNGQPDPAQLLTFGDLNVGSGTVFDVDGDSGVEVFLDNFAGVQLWRRMGAQYVPEGATYPVPDCGYLGGAITSADFDKDGITDVAFLGIDTCGDKDLDLLPPSEGRVMLGRPDHTFVVSEEITAGTKPTQALVGDFDGDTNLDLAIGNERSDDVSILLGQGDGNFGPDMRHRPTIQQLGQIAVGDLDGDGADELLIRGESQLFAVSTPHLGGDPILLLPDVFGPIAVGDFNQDGVDDVAVRKNDGSDHLVLLISEVP